MKATISLKFLACLKCNLNGRFLSKTKCALEQIKFLLYASVFHQYMGGRCSCDLPRQI